MRNTATILPPFAMLAILVGAVGCERGPADIGAPPGESPSDKRPCPAVPVTYADPITIDEPWSGGVKDFSLVDAGGRYHLFHITDPATSWITRNGELAFGHATSGDLAVWCTHERIDLRTDPGGWSPSFTWAPHIVERDGLYYMFYTGVKWDEGAPPSSAEQRVGLAVSTDLFTWKRYDAGGEDGLILDGPQNADHPWSAFGTAELDLPWEHDCRDPFIFDRGPEQDFARYLMLNSVRLAPDAALMAIAFAFSEDLVNWRWAGYFPITVGVKAESANLVERDGAFYLFWTDSDHAPAVRVARSTGGVFGEYRLVNGGDRLFGLGNETLVEPDRTFYLAFDDYYVLHVKRDLLLPAAPHDGARVRLMEFTACDGVGVARGLAP